MKKSIFLFSIFTLLATSLSYSQNFNGNINGVDRSIGSEVRENKPSKKNKEKMDYADAYVKYLNSELKLDGLQQAAIKVIINDNKDSLEQIANSNLPSIEKKDKIDKITSKITDSITKLLSPEQKEKFLKIKEVNDKKALTN